MTSALLHCLILASSTGFTPQGSPSEQKNTILISKEPIFDPSKELLKQRKPIPLESESEIINQALKGELVVSSKSVVAIYRPTVIQQFKEYANLQILRAFKEGSGRVMGRTDQDEWAKVFYRQILTNMTTPYAKAAQVMLDNNGFAESPGEVTIDAAYGVETQISGKRILIYCHDWRVSDTYQYWLGKNYAWGSVPSVRTDEEHIYATVPVWFAKLERKSIDEALAKIFKSDRILEECSKRVRAESKLPIGKPIKFSELPAEYKENILVRAVGLLKAQGVKVEKLNEAQMPPVTISRLGVSVTMTLGLQNKESFYTVTIPLGPVKP